MILLLTLLLATSRATLPDLPHARVDHFVELFTTGEKCDEIAAAFERKASVEKMISEKLRRKGMPQELIYLAMAESGLNPKAHSRDEAIGIWQLIPDTARRYGLKVNAEVDERRDAAKATDAALSYLAYLYNRFGSWYLAAAAYNSGENRVARIMKEETGAESGTDADFYRIVEKLPGETRDFVPAMIALSRIAREKSGP